MDHIEFVNEFCSSYLPKCTDLQIGKLVKDVMGCLEYLRSVEFHSDMPSRIVFSKAQENVRNFIRTNFGTFDLPSSQDNALVLAFPHDRSLSFSAYPMGDVANALSNLNVHRSMSHNGTFVTQNLSLPLNNDNAIDSIRSSVNGSLSIIPSRQEQIDIATTSISPWGDPGTFGTISAGYKPATASLNGLHVNHGGLNANGLGLRSSLQLGLHSGLDLDSPSILSRPSLPSNYNLSLYEYSRLRSARCNNMALLVKFGTMGNELGRFNSPHGFCLGFDEEIVVADTYNHRIQIFSKSGEYLSYFGVSGKVDGLLWFPRKVAIIRQSQRYVVCDRGNERSRMQLFSRSGHFVRRIQIKFIDIVAGLAINQQGQIVAVDSVTPGVFVVSEEGDLIHWLDCSAFMREPSDIAIRGREYFICDFKAHCVVVIQEDGQYLRTIGGESITDFPNGIDVSGQGDVLVGDSHGNRFHIAVFTGKGELISEFVCMQTKVSRSCCLKITNEGYIVTLARSSNNVLVMSTLYVN
ncbi:Brain tumor protein [Taenia solium]|eukprot:TsM_000078900 transcript=TsM_000078900 gene=TsM_000078900